MNLSSQQYSAGCPLDKCLGRQPLAASSTLFLGVLIYGAHVNRSQARQQFYVSGTNEK